MAHATTNGKATQPRKPTLRQQLAEALARADKAEAALLARPATATPPPGGHCPEALQPEAEGVLRVWVMTSTDGYRLHLNGMDHDFTSWALHKWSDGTTYHLCEDRNTGELLCDCPGCVAHGPRCAGGKGCKHLRMLRALRSLVDPGI